MHVGRQRWRSGEPRTSPHGEDGEREPDFWELGKEVVWAGVQSAGGVLSVCLLQLRLMSHHWTLQDLPLPEVTVIEGCPVCPRPAPPLC